MGPQNQKSDDSLLSLCRDVHMVTRGNRGWASEEEKQHAFSVLKDALMHWQQPSSPFDMSVYILIASALAEAGVQVEFVPTIKLHE